jgi:hypothetical protein
MRKHTGRAAVSDCSLGTNVWKREIGNNGGTESSTHLEKLLVILGIHQYRFCRGDTTTADYSAIVAHEQCPLSISDATQSYHILGREKERFGEMSLFPTYLHARQSLRVIAAFSSLVFDPSAAISA